MTARFKLGTAMFDTDSGRWKTGIILVQEDLDIVCERRSVIELSRHTRSVHVLNKISYSFMRTYQHNLLCMDLQPHILCHIYTNSHHQPQPHTRRVDHT